VTISGFTSTGSKRPHVLFGPPADGLPHRMQRSAGCTTTADGRDYIDCIMALGAVALGYGDAGVNAAVLDAVERGGVGALSPEEELLLAAELGAVIPWMEKIRLLKTGAEAVAAAVRIARVATGRDQVVGCGYHGWLDWCSDSNGVPEPTRQLFSQLAFNDPQHARDTIRNHADRLACVVVEPLIDGAPSTEWLATLRQETQRVGALLVFDEIKTGFRVAIGGAAEKWQVQPDLMVLGKALANGYPLAAIGGPREFMDHANQTWISSTLATEFVSIAAARATITAFKTRHVVRHLDQVGSRLFKGLQRLAVSYADLGVEAVGVAQMCYLRHRNQDISQSVTRECARRGLLFKRTAYNFVSLAHDDDVVDRILTILEEALAAC
jgi:glutamate-1-semialdehyde 2,1-aminomutase